MRRIAFVSDIHGNLPALEAVAGHLGRQAVDVVVNLGDALSGPLFALDTARWLMARSNARSPDAPAWLHIAGNHERQLLSAARRLQQGPRTAPTPNGDELAAAQLDAAALGWVAALTRSTDAALHGGLWRPDLLGADVALCHGIPANDLIYLLETPDGETTVLASEAEIRDRLGPHVPASIGMLACGHSHLPRHVTLRRESGRLQLVNPGSVGQPAYDDDTPFPRSTYHRVENGSPDARYAIAKKDDTAEAWTVQLISVPYDVEPSARLAEARGCPDWAHALRTGRLPRPGD